MTKNIHSLESVRDAQKLIQQQVFRFVMGNLVDSAVRNTNHFRQWFHCPMNYARIMELPLTMLMLEATQEDRILDVSSPKLLTLCYALMGCNKVVAADMEDYFIHDFDVYGRRAGLTIETSVFDATEQIPYPAAYFDKIFSISVLEHIPNDGDSRAVEEMLRVLKMSGTLVITVPVFSQYTEEWVSSKKFYWNSAVDEKGRFFVTIQV